MTSEYQIQLIWWIELLPNVQHALNNTPSPQHNTRVAAFTGLKPLPPRSTFHRSVSVSVIELEELKQDNIFNIDQPQNALNRFI